MSNLRLFGKDLQVINNPALKSMWGDLMGEGATITSEDLLTHPLVSGQGEAPDPGPKPTVLQQIRNRYPLFASAAVSAAKELETQRLPVERYVVRGDFIAAEASAIYGCRSSRTFKIA